MSITALILAYNESRQIGRANWSIQPFTDQLCVVDSGSTTELGLLDYRTLFGEHFDIVNERFENPDQGKQYLSPSIRQELAEYDEELFANRVLFVLKPVRRVAN